jgi:hypothetical protein
VPEVIVRAIYPIDKGDLDILRLLHFLALALLCWRMLPCDLPLLRPLVQCGEYSLVIYCISVLLSFAAHAILNLGWNDLVSQTLVSVAGIAVMAAAAVVLANVNRTAEAHPCTLWSVRSVPSLYRASCCWSRCCRLESRSADCGATTRKSASLQRLTCINRRPVEIGSHCHQRLLD